MRLCFEGDRFHLGRGQTVGLRDGKGTHVQVLSGELWVTQEGDRRDLVFRNGDRFEVERDGITVLHALMSTRLQVEDVRSTPARAALWWKALGRRAMRHFIELGMHRAAKKRVYRL